jgi:hypothetical protein
MSQIIKQDGLQVTMPLFENSLLSSTVEAALPVSGQARVCHYITIKGGIPVRSCCSSKRLFAAGSIRTRIER